MRKLLILILFHKFLYSEEVLKDTLKYDELQEVLLIETKHDLENNNKILASVDEYLIKSSKINMIKRGSYAWEPLINNMATERTVITIDGMRIFSACTDKMDPVTSYIEISNLSEANIHSGQEGSHFGNTIGGSVNLKQIKTVFGEKNLNLKINSGFESNNKHKIIGSSLKYYDSSFYNNTGIMYRDAQNYFSGGNKEVLFSQFKKFNLSQSLAYKIDLDKFLEASIIYDKATDVGYPALPMDISFAEALISSFKFDYSPRNFIMRNLELKIYYNNITHRMDDTKRPFVPINMDMPGWSNTIGYYSKFKFNYQSHDFLINLNSFYNKSLAEMTMYPSNPKESLMFMLTWPDVRTFYNGIFLEDFFMINDNSNIKTGLSLGSHYNKIESQFGLNSLKIFFPDMNIRNNRFLKSFFSNYNYTNNGFEYGIGIAYGERAPSVTEAYGFYIFNSFDGFDNIGNPYLKNENSMEANAYIGFKNYLIKTKLSSSYFHILNYIIAQPDFSLSPMTIGANGVKIYNSLDYATIFNINLNIDFILSEYLKSGIQLAYSRGKDFKNENLPFISPFSYKYSLDCIRGNFSGEIQIQGHTTQINYNSFYGEDKTPGYTIINLNLGYKFYIFNGYLLTNLGIENILDKYYSTYSDWNNIPRMGRNIFLNLSFLL